MRTTTVGLVATLPLLIGLGSLGISRPPAQQATEVHSIHCFYGCPLGTKPGDDLLFRHIYTMATDDATRFAAWVAYRLDSLMVSGPNHTTRLWQADPWLDPGETLEEEDYDGANAALGTDRGHQAPLAAFKGTDYWAETNILSNITPQQADLNQGLWQQLEARERALALGGEVFVVTGPLYERAMPPLPRADEPHRVPSGYWKILFFRRGAPQRTYAAAFIFDQATPRRGNLADYLTSIAEVERRSGFRFLHELSADVQARLRQDAFEGWALLVPAS